MRTPEVDGPEVDGPEVDGPEVDGPADAVVVRHEERLVAAVRAVPYERLVVRKVVVTETVTQTVEVRREELRVDRFPVDDAQGVVDVTAVGGLAARGDRVLEIVLREERPVVGVQVVPVERVLVRTRVVSAQTDLRADVRTEQVEVEATGLPRV